MQETGTRAQEEEPEERPELANLRVRGRSVKTWVIGAGAVVLAISAAFGGLNKADAETPALTAGATVDAGQFAVIVDRMVAVKDLEPTFKPDPGGALLVAVTRLKVTDDLGTTPPSDLIRLIGVPGIKDTDPPLGVSTVDDNTTNPVLTPDVEQTIAFVWKLPKLSELPTEAKVTVQGYKHYDESILDHHEKWLPDAIAAEGTIKVKDNTKVVTK
ncbi:hypothetical protein E1263_32815 [Kribbella antibiotica]|uniref:Uncharacterized protein n=1 Tax=Kribbella antibiotica TaxID=190195 RepID=A0A4R4YYM7_9ACTN|nr:hypothetical protein [Kribbella antibiotica]TDD48842.1 hypothetical protein E1263_32815 [Kribbella antibiotica]